MNDDAAGTDLGSVTGLPLPAMLEELLRSLEPIRTGRHHRRPSDTPLRESHAGRDAGLVSRRVGFTVPTLSVLRAQGESEFFSVPADEMRPVGGMAEEERNSISIVYVASERLLDLPVERAVMSGATYVGVSFGRGRLWPQIETPHTRRSPASGDSTVVDVRGTVVGVQHRRKGETRLAWASRGPGVSFDVEVWTGRRPVEAVRLLAASDLFEAAVAPSER